MNKPFLFFLAILMVACKEPEKKIPAQESIAKAYGIDQWGKVNSIAFTFNVNRDTSHFERSFIWEPKTKKVSYFTATDTIRYQRDSVKRISLVADKNFVNDKYWLLAPFQLLWDQGATFLEKEGIAAPISKEVMNVLTITYPAEGGYTPGDAYDFYYDKDFIIKEWVYRQKNQPEPSMVTTWEENKDFEGIKISTVHQDSTGHFKLYFTNISIQ